MNKTNGKYLIVCTIVGGCLGGYISYINNNYIYSAIGPLIGIYFGLYLNKLASIGDLHQIRSKKYDKLFIVIGIIMSLLGIVAYYYTKKIDMIIASIFFFIGSIYLMVVKPNNK